MLYTGRSTTKNKTPTKVSVCQLRSCMERLDGQRAGARLSSFSSNGMVHEDVEVVNLKVQVLHLHRCALFLLVGLGVGV